MATQDFNQTDGTQIHTLSGWAQATSVMECWNSHAHCANGSGDVSAAVYTGTDLTDDHSSELTTTIFTGGFRTIGPSVRMAASSSTFYGINSRGDYNTTDLVEVTSGTIAALDVGALHTGTHTWKLSVAGTSNNLNMYLDGSLDSDIANPVTDGTITTGDPGIWGSGTLNSSSNYGDSWEGLQVGGGATGNPWHYYAQAG